MGNCALEGPQTGWKTVRLGNFAYDMSGNILNSSKSWFIKKIEVEKLISQPDIDDYDKEIYGSMVSCGRI